MVWYVRLHEATRFKQVCGDGFLLVTPGIRPAGSEVGDQRRVMTPEQAIVAGVDYMRVIGRPITRSENPLETLQQINSFYTRCCATWIIILGWFILLILVGLKKKSRNLHAPAGDGIVAYPTSNQWPW